LKAVRAKRVHAADLQRRSKSDPLSNIFQIHLQLGLGASRGGIEIQCGAHGVSQRVVGRTHSLSERNGEQTLSA
jgi:hypothetical protein